MKVIIMDSCLRRNDSGADANFNRFLDKLGMTNDPLQCRGLTKRFYFRCAYLFGQALEEFYAFG